MNAAFNCCPGDIAADIRIQDDTITIVEREEQSMCDCSCLYVLYFEIRNLEPRPYTIRFVELYVPPEDERLEFTADLATPRTFPGEWSAPTGPIIPGDTRQRSTRTGRSSMPCARGSLELIGTPSCGGDGDCRYIGLGAKPCGGVWEYLVYSTPRIDPDYLKYLRLQIQRIQRRFQPPLRHLLRLHDRDASAVGCVAGSAAFSESEP